MINTLFGLIQSTSIVTLLSMSAMASSAEPSGNADEEAADERSKFERRLNELEAALLPKKATVTKEALASYNDQIELEGTRAYKKSGENEFPWQLKCTTADFRTFHGCLELRFFDPSARVYFDGGSDDPDEVDIFNDGNLNITVELASVYFPWRLGRAQYFDAWSWGPVFGAGIGAPAEDSPDGTMNVSGAPVVLFSAGGMLEYKLPSKASFSFEMGYSQGFSSDESFADIDDGAVYVGLRIHVPIGERKTPANN